MQKVDKPLVSIISINWNSTKVTCEFLQSVKDSNTYDNIELIIVDNNSATNPFQDLISIYPKLKFIRNDVNLGFAGGNNVGIKASSGDFLFLVNNDTEFTPGLVEGLVEVFDNYQDVGMVSPKFRYFFQNDTIEYAGYNKVNMFTGRNGMIGCKEKDIGQYNIIRQTHYGHGGGMMVSKEVIDQVGLMPDIFFLYYEEFDWSNKIKKNGFKIYYQPKSLIFHKESMTTGKSSPLKTYYLTRNRILFMKRNQTKISFSLFLLYFTLFTIPKNTIVYLLRREIKHLQSFWKGIAWHFNHNITFN